MQDPNKDTPSDLRRWIKKFGGVNPFGDPMWRLVRAENVTCIRAGLWRTMPTGEPKFYGRDREGRVHSEIPKPTCERQGVFEVPRYPKPGWILERWMPARMWGSREQWESEKSIDGITPMMGPYPERGDYFLMDGPFDFMPTRDLIQRGMLQYERQIEQAPANAMLAIQSLTNSMKLMEKRKRAAFQKEMEHMGREIYQVLTSTSLTAQLVRNQTAKRLGLTSHQGVI